MRSHQESITIRFDDADPAGVVFYPRALGLAHAVVENLIRHSPLGWEAWFASPTHAAPLRHADADFLIPLRAGEIFVVSAIVEKLGATSVTFLVEFIQPKTDAVAARIRTVHVLIDKCTGMPTRLPVSVREALG